MIIAIDAMGGDLAPKAVIDGITLALPQMDSATTIKLFGDEQQINPLLPEELSSSGRVEVIHTTQIVTCEDSPTGVIRSKKDSSLIRAVTAVANGEADCVVSAGSTGALLSAATLIIKRIPNVKRPALAPLLPSLTGGHVLLIDGGANTDCKSEYLEQFGVMGSAYMRGVCGIASPRVGLLNNGTEETKGNELTKSAHALLKANEALLFAGNCEARDVLSGDFDVVVCDGFDGNVLLKGLEGAVGAVMSILKDGLMSGLRTKLGALLAKPAFRKLKHTMDYTEHGGAPLLGVNGGVIKAHGSSNAKAFSNAFLQAERIVASDVCGTIRENLSNAK